MPLSAVEGEAKNVSRRVPLATNPLCRQANNASAPPKGKEGDDSNYPARSGERSEKALPNSTLYKGGIGQQRQPLKECVAKRQRCAESETEQIPYERSECGIAEA